MKSEEDPTCKPRESTADEEARNGGGEEHMKMRGGRARQYIEQEPEPTSVRCEGRNWKQNLFFFN